MAELNKIKCAVASGGNTGIPDCYLDPKQIVGIILTPDDYSLSESDLATLQSTLEAATAADKGSRIYPLINFVDLPTDNTQDPTTQDFGYGSTIIVREGDYDLTFQYSDGGLCLHKNLRQFNTGKWGAYLVDANGIIFGYKNDTSLNAIPLKQFYANPWKMATGSAVAQFTLRITFAPKYLNELVGFVQTADDFDIATAITGLLGLVIEESAALDASYTVKVKVKTSCGGSNIYETYKTALSQVGAWKGTNVASGNAVTITSVTANDGDKDFSILLDNTDTDYPTSGQKLTIGLEKPSVLSGLTTPITGYESNTLTETAP